MLWSFKEELSVLPWGLLLSLLLHERSDCGAFRAFFPESVLARGEVRALNDLVRVDGNASGESAEEGEND